MFFLLLLLSQLIAVASVWILHFPSYERERYALNSLFIFFTSPTHTHTSFPFAFDLGVLFICLLLRAWPHTLTHTHTLVCGRLNVKRNP